LLLPIRNCSTAAYSDSLKGSHIGHAHNQSRRFSVSSGYGLHLCMIVQFASHCILGRSEEQFKAAL
jgi:hypothetical protein